MCSPVMTGMFTKFSLHVDTVVALCDNDSTDPDKLSFKESECLQIVDASNLGWWKAHSLVTGKEGYILSPIVAPVENIKKQEYVTHVM